MNPIEERTLAILNRSTEIICELPDSARWLEEINALKIQVYMPCKLAVGGRVKEGKSTFINTLLGANLSLVGTQEATATINQFVYGKSEDPSHPIKVVYKDGKEEFVSQSFMDSLQGHDPKMAEKRRQILYFEHPLEHPILKDIILIDTPGTGAVVDDHQETAERVFGINIEEEKILRKEHDAQTRELTARADAVIYLMGAVGNMQNKEFLDSFSEVCDGASALNAIGVISRIDEDEAVLYNAQSQASYVAESLKERLSGVLPVSAVLYSSLKNHEQEFGSWQQMIKTIPEEIFAKYLTGTPGAWNGDKDVILLKRYPQLLPADIRQRMKGDIPWGAFRAIVKMLYQESDIEVAKQKLYELANFDEVKRVLQEQFFNRSKAIRCTVLLSKLNKILLGIRNDAMYTIKRAAKKSSDWESFINSKIRPEDSSTAAEMIAFIRAQIKTREQIDRLDKSILEELVKPTEQLLNEIQGQNMDYKMLKEVQNNRERFSEELYAELCELFGLHKSHHIISEEQKRNRQMFWQGKSMRYMDPKMQEIAVYAAQTYGRL